MKYLLLFVVYLKRSEEMCAKHYNSDIFQNLTFEICIICKDQRLPELSVWLEITEVIMVALRIWGFSALSLLCRNM
jgi:hypothetical protein